MESIWDYVMRRKPIFLGYFALFLISVFASCQLLSGIMPQDAIDEPAIVQETPQYEQYDRVLSPESVALLANPEDNQTNPNEAIIPEPTISLNFVQVDVTNPTNITDPTTDESSVDIPLTSAPQSPADVAPRKVSIFRTVLAVLLAVTALTLAGLGLYQAYNYLAPYIEKYLQNNR